jgi:hypothetical protein
MLGRNARPFVFDRDAHQRLAQRAVGQGGNIRIAGHAAAVVGAQRQQRCVQLQPAELEQHAQLATVRAEFDRVRDLKQQETEGTQ